jgi:hypothetical protein
MISGSVVEVNLDISPITELVFVWLVQIELSLPYLAVRKPVFIYC